MYEVAIKKTKETELKSLRSFHLILIYRGGIYRASVCKSIQKKYILDYEKKKDERGIEGGPVLEWELSHTPSIVEPLETPII
jgi:hypothetical protein